MLVLIPVVWGNWEGQTVLPAMMRFMSVLLNAEAAVMAVRNTRILTLVRRERTVHQVLAIMILRQFLKNVIAALHLELVISVFPNRRIRILTLVRTVFRFLVRMDIVTPLQGFVLVMKLPELVINVISCQLVLLDIQGQDVLIIIHIGFW